MASDPEDDCGCDRRTLLRRAAAAGAVGWTAPVILVGSPAAAGVFTAKCAPGTITGTGSFVQTVCNNAGTRVRITLNFAGPCPCGGTAQWCVQKNSPGSTQSTTTSSIVISNVFVPFAGGTTVTGKVALGCTDRDGDTQFAVYDWSVTAFDSGGPCSIANSLSAVTVNNRTIVDSPTCPSLNAAFASPAFATDESSVVPGVRPPG